MAAPKRGYETVDEYIATFPKSVQVSLRQMRRIIVKNAPGAEEVISYGMPAFRLNGILVYFAAFKDHIGFFPTASGVAAFKKELGPYRHSKGTIQFPLDRPIPSALVKRIVKFRAKENLGKKRE